MKKPPTSCTFSDFNFSPDLFQIIKAAGYTVPTAVQCKAIPAILHNRDVLAGAETGSGKTAAFALPLLEKLRQQKQGEAYSSAKGNHVRALILVPTRELALQISETVNHYAQALVPRIKAVAVFGGVKINPQMMALRGGADVLVATPGRLLDLVSHNAIKFNKLHTLVLDEVDRLVGEGFKEEIEAVFKLLPNQRQNLMFTATFPSSIRYLIRRLLKKPVIINIDPSQETLIDQRVFTVNYDQKNALLAHLLATYDWKQVLIFCSAKRSCDNLVKKLESREIAATAMHSNKEQRARSKALREFKAGDTRVLIATDVAARGLDIEQLPCVINFELPRSPNDYTHRIGRTGRAGEAGFAISLIAHHEYAHFSVIEKHSGVELKREQIAGFEADAIAPPTPTRQRPKKKARTKLSKKKRQRLLDKKKQNQYETSVAPQKISKHEDSDGTRPYTKKAPTPTYKAQGSSTADQPPRKKSVAALGTKFQYSRSNEASADQAPRKKAEAALDTKSPYNRSNETSADQPPRKKAEAALGTKSPYNRSEERLPRKNQVARLDKTPASPKPHQASQQKSKNTAVWATIETSGSHSRNTRRPQTPKPAWNPAEKDSVSKTSRRSETPKPAWNPVEKTSVSKTSRRSETQHSSDGSQYAQRPPAKKSVWESNRQEKPVENAASTKTPKTIEVKNTDSTKPPQTTEVKNTTSAKTAKTTEVKNTTSAKPPKTTEMKNTDSTKTPKTTEMKNTTSTKPPKIIKVKNTDSTKPPQTTEVKNTTSAKTAKTTEVKTTASTKPPQTTEVKTTASAKTTKTTGSNADIWSSVLKTNQYDS